MVDLGRLVTIATTVNLQFSKVNFNGLIMQLDFFFKSLAKLFENLSTFN